MTEFIDFPTLDVPLSILPFFLNCTIDSPSVLKVLTTRCDIVSRSLDGDAEGLVTDDSAPVTHPKASASPDQYCSRPIHKSHNLLSNPGNPKHLRTELAVLEISSDLPWSMPISPLLARPLCSASNNRKLLCYLTTMRPLAFPKQPRNYQQQHHSNSGRASGSREEAWQG